MGTTAVLGIHDELQATVRELASSVAVPETFISPEDPPIAAALQAEADRIIANANGERERFQEMLENLCSRLLDGVVPQRVLTGDPGWLPRSPSTVFERAARQSVDSLFAPAPEPRNPLLPDPQRAIDAVTAGAAS